MAKAFSRLWSIFNTFKKIGRQSERVRTLQKTPGTNTYRVVNVIHVTNEKHLSSGDRHWITQHCFRFRAILSAPRMTYFPPNPVETAMSNFRNMNPPDAVRGMTVLDKSKFKKVIQMPCIRVPLKRIGKLVKIMSKSMVKAVKLKPIADLGDDDPEKDTKRLFLFNPEKYSTYEDLDQSDRKSLLDNGVSATEFEKLDIELTYDNWSVQDTLRAILPQHQDGVTGFSTIGHIAHLNLRNESFPFKHIIGEVILDKTQRIKTVVNKLEMIDNTFRNLRMELLAGDDNYMTQAKENGCIYEFDFSQVYWNPRLSTEHEVIINQLERHDVVYDVFAGVGPFAIPAGKRGIVVHANDLNPASFTSLQKNIALNKLKDGVVTAYKLDGRDFVRTVLRAGMIARLTSGDPPKGDVHVLMNLPASAVEFLDTFLGLLDGSEIPHHVNESQFPMVHCYCFSRGDDPDKDVQDQGETILGGPITSNVVVRFVRNVAPHKNMMCLSFRLTKDILFKGDVECLDAPEAKRLKKC